MAAHLLFHATIAALLAAAWGHGMLLDPVGRSSLWRYDSSAPQNYDDNQLYCGGMSVQWSTFGGQCGVCGDVYSASHPQPNENTGTYGQGKVVETYLEGSVIETYVKLTTNHRGHIQYSLCVLEDASRPEPEDCFVNLRLEDGAEVYPVSSEEKEIHNNVVLPAGVTCDRCVLRWEYVAGNNWGNCGDGTQAEGCGPQETFRNCADISIH